MAREQYKMAREQYKMAREQYKMTREQYKMTRESRANAALLPRLTSAHERRGGEEGLLDSKMS